MKNVELGRSAAQVYLRPRLLAGLVGVVATLPVLVASATTGPTIVISGNDKTVTRPTSGSKLLRFQITRTGDLTFPQPVNYQTADGTGPDAAIAGIDYTATSGTATIPAGQDSVIVTVPILASGSASSNVQFRLRLGVGQGDTTNLAPQQLFSTRIGDVGAGPSAVALADINGDGRSEIIITNSRINNVAGLFNTTPRRSSTASFSAPQTLVTGTGPTALAVADFNADGLPDGVVANRGANTVTVYYNSTGSSIPSTNFSTPPGPNSVVVGEFDGDTSPDIAIVSDSGPVTILVGSTAFTSRYTFTLPAGASPDSIAAGDINGDGRTDLVIADYDLNSVSVALNTGGGNFAVTTIPVGTHPTSVEVADLDGDGLPDVIVAESNDNTVSVLRNTTATSATTPTFVARQTLVGGQFPVAVKAADINRDGRLDVLIADAGAGQLGFLRNTSTSGAVSFATLQSFEASSNPSSIAVGDINGDNRADVVVSNFTPSTVSVFLSGASASDITFVDSTGVIVPNPRTP